MTELAISAGDPAIAQPPREVIRGLIKRVAVRWDDDQPVIILDEALIGLTQNARKPRESGVGWS